MTFQLEILYAVGFILVQLKPILLKQTFQVIGSKGREKKPI